MYKIMKLAKLMVFLLFAVEVSCVKEELAPESRVEEGLPARISLNFNAKSSAVVTRAVQDETIESRVSNIYLFIFDSAGNKIFGEFFPSPSNPLVIDAASANDVRIVGVANVTDAQTSSGYDIDTEMLNGIQTISELEAMKLSLLTETVSRGNAFLMTGFAEYIETSDGHNAGDTDIDIPFTEGIGAEDLGCTLYLERVDSKIIFNVTAENPNATPDAEGKSWKEFSFQPREWRVCRVPDQSKALKSRTGNEYSGTTGDYSDSDAVYFDTDYVPFEDIQRNDETALFEGGSFAFYMPENRKTPKQNIPTSTDASEMYAMREKREQGNPVEDQDKPGQQYGQGDFVYANGYSTYVEMTGTLSYIDKENYLVSANVRLTVHLGYAGYNPDDYSTNRNTSYTYNVKVCGINDIEVEVSDGSKEPRPGYEGDIVYASNETFYLDAHYDRVLLHIPKNLIKYTADDGTQREMSWGISTPFETGMYREGSSLKDYKWIKFAINSEYDTSASGYVKYPGDQNYHDESLPSDASNNAPPGSYYNGKNVSSDVRLMDVKQLVERLKSEYDNPQSRIFSTVGGEEVVAVTAFVDEYIYVKHPTDDLYSGDPLLLWKETVETDDRQLHITSGRMQYSADGASSVVESIFSFRQKAVRTVYDKTKVDRAWGVESVMEAVGNVDDDSRGIRLKGGDVSRGSSLSNGRSNTIACLNLGGTLHWSDIVNTDSYSLKPDHQTAVYAALTRNRDLNGDDIVQAEEIRWYLASINQLTDLYLGEYALDMDARLYPENAVDRPGGRGLYWHYTTSSADGDNPWVLWAEEGASKGSYGSSQNKNGELYSYRCIRNLGIALDNLYTEPEPLIQCTPENDGTYLVDATRLNPKARRGYIASDLPDHDDDSQNNLLYDRFRVSSSDSDMGNNGQAPTCEPSGGGLFTDPSVEFTNVMIWDQCLAQEGYLSSYRLPNERELLVMSSVLPENAFEEYVVENWAGRQGRSKAMYMCKTRFSLAGQGHFGTRRESFRMNAEDGSLGVLNDSGSDRGYMRGVRDER